jgi:hypothetical protein
MPICLEPSLQSGILRPAFEARLERNSRLVSHNIALSALLDRSILEAYIHMFEVNNANKHDIEYFCT